MTAIVMNTLNGAVSEYGWTFVSITNKHAAENAALHTLGGDTDDGAQIVGEVRGGKPGGQQVQAVSNVFVAVDSADDGVVLVEGKDTTWEYPITKRASGVYAVSPGKGIRESYLGFGYRNVNGADFELDRIDAETAQSTNRRK